MRLAFRRNGLKRTVVTACGLSALLAASVTTGSGASADEPRPGGARNPSLNGPVITLTTVKVGAPGNPSVGILPFKDALYRSCADAPSLKECLRVGGVPYRYEIGQLEVTVEQWVAFLNTVDPVGRNRLRLYDETESSTAWPRYGQINLSPSAGTGRHYSVAFPQWADKPYGFANFLRAARFVNSLYNGRLVSKRTSSKGTFNYVTYQVALSPQTERGMYELAKPKTTRVHRTGFVLPSQDEWIKAAYYDPRGGGTYSYWKYPTNPGVFGDGAATAPSPTVLAPGTGEVTNAATQPLASYHADGKAAPSWCPQQLSPEACSTGNPLGFDPVIYAKAYQGSLSAVGEARTTSPWGTLDQGGNAVEWTDTITAPPSGQSSLRVWRRLHGGISNAPAYQMWPSAVGLQPQDNVFYNHTYPWLGLRIGVIGD
ncbi:hypothetical protein ABT052_40545 [Streptomyces sp. NPDC002766]|uniref:hypothetical protein n=1 Tax=unclassified Streptomyces TaxID=2593676 RepID=UPI00331928FB